MGRLGPTLGADDVVVLALDADIAALADIPHLAQDVDRLLERLDALAGRAARTAHRDDAIPEPARADADTDAPAGEEVQAGGRPRDDGRLAQRQVQDVGREMDAVSGSSDIRDERPGVEQRGLVRVVLEGHQVEACLLAELRERYDVLWTPALRREERAEAKVVAVVGHGVVWGKGSLVARAVLSGWRARRARSLRSPPSRGAEASP